MQESGEEKQSTPPFAILWLCAAASMLSPLHPFFANTLRKAEVARKIASRHASTDPPRRALPRWGCQPAVNAFWNLDMNDPVSKEHQPTVLVVEDDEIARDAMTRILVREGYLVLTAESGHAALDILRAPLSPIDVVLLDVHLPDVSGIDLCARIREMYANMPVVVCTGEAEPQEAARLLEMGVQRYFRKPIAVDELLATVEAALP